MFTELQLALLMLLSGLLLGLRLLLRPARDNS
jgi:hypothetical protein